jgi:site-specific DNA-cytosine methylase
LEIIKNISLFSNAGIGEYGTSQININNNNNNIYKIQTVIANELLPQRAEIYKLNYPYTNMIVGSITEKEIIKEIVENFNKELPETGTFSPPCQGSSGLNSSKNKTRDFRNQLVKSIFQMFDKVEKNSLKYGYIENVVSYYKETIPAKTSTGKMFHYYIETEEGILTYNNFAITEQKLETKQNVMLEGKMKPIVFNNKTFNYFYAFDEADSYIETGNELIINSITIKEYIDKSMDSFGYKGILNNIRGDEYGASQIRLRGFYIFHKSDISIEFPKKLYTSFKKTEIYQGKTVLDTLKVMDLIKIFKTKKEAKDYIKQRESKYFSDEIVERQGKFYVDTAISEKEINKQLKEQKNIDYHFSYQLNNKYMNWLKNTKENTSAYFNKERHHRPYKAILVTKKGILSRNNFVIEEDTKEWFEKNKVIDYFPFLTEDMKNKLPNEFGENKRNWVIRNIEDRKILEKTMIKYAQDLLINEEDYYYLFLPIKGFEVATYRRLGLDIPSSALTTKMNYGNSNTVHPIFNRTWTPAETLALFGVGYIIEENGNYVKSKPYKIPISNRKSVSLRNFIYEITGEAILSIVAENLLKDCTIQYFNNKK